MGHKTTAALALLVGVWSTQIGLAADLSLVPSVTQRSEFNSNVAYSFRNPISDYIFSLQPAADFNYTTEVSQLQGRLQLKGLHYITHSNLDHVDQNYQINGQYQATPRLGLNLKSAYIVDTTVQEELLTSGLAMSNTPRQSFQVGPGVTYALMERLLATVSYNFNKVNYQDPRFRNYTSQQVGLRLDRPLKNQQTTLSGNVIARRTTYPGSDFYQGLGFYLGINHKFSENWEVNLLAGANYSSFDFGTQVLDFSSFPYFILLKQTRVKTTDVTPYFDISTIRRWTNLSITGGYSQDQSPSAYGYVVELKRLYLTLNYNFTERLRGSLITDYSISTQASQRTDIKYDYFNLGPQFTYQVTEKFTVNPGYRFSWRDFNNGGGSVGSQSVNIHQAWVMLTYSYPLHYQR